MNVVYKILDAFKFRKPKKAARAGCSRKRRTVRRDGPSSAQIMATREWVLDQIENAMNDDNAPSVDDADDDQVADEPESGVA